MTLRNIFFWRLFTKRKWRIKKNISTKNTIAMPMAVNVVFDGDFLMSKENILAAYLWSFIYANIKYFSVFYVNIAFQFFIQCFFLSATDVW